MSKANDYLNRYRVMFRLLNHRELELRELRARAEGLKSANGGELAWTGKYITIEGRQERELVPEPRGAADPERTERVLCKLADLSTEADRLREEVKKTGEEIERTIDRCCEGLTRVAMKYRYLQGLTLRETASRIGAGKSYTCGLLREGTEKIGEFLGF